LEESATSNISRYGKYSHLKLSIPKGWAEIHQALLSHFSLLAEFLIGKVLAKDKDSIILKVAILNPGFYTVVTDLHLR
jgi:hypothetical protein